MGEEGEEVIPEYLTGKHVEVENEWILVPRDNEEETDDEEEDVDTEAQTIRSDVHVECTLRYPDEENMIARSTTSEEDEEEDLHQGLGELLEIVKEDAKRVGDCKVVPTRTPLRDMNSKV